MTVCTADNGHQRAQRQLFCNLSFLYATTSEPKIGASNLIRQLDYESLDPDHLLFLDDKMLGPLYV